MWCMMVDTSDWQVPFDVRWLVDRLHVGEPYPEVRREVLRRLKPSKRKDHTVRRAVVKAAMRAHYLNRRLYAQVMGGM